MDKPLPCIVCGKQLQPIWNDKQPCFQPVGGLMFDAGAGHYGSGVWDIMSRDRALHVNICDDCLIERKDRVAVVEQVVRRESEYVWKPWRPEHDE